SHATTFCGGGRRDEGVYVTPTTVGLTGVTIVMIIKPIDDNMDIV
ncbi:hypothetical protein Tco_1037160, partial [Tanacetum coccineum]